MSEPIKNPGMREWTDHDDMPASWNAVGEQGPPLPVVEATCPNCGRAIAAKVGAVVGLIPSEYRLVRVPCDHCQTFFNVAIQPLPPRDQDAAP